jgi:MFS family permease
LTVQNSNNKVRRTLKLSVLDGTGWALMSGFTVNYITPFALALKATTTQVGLLTSIPNFCLALCQLFAPGLVEKSGSRKKLLIQVLLVQALMFIPILLVPYLFSGAPIFWLITFVTINMVFGAIGNPAWQSMMADIVPINIRGRYFGFRGSILGLATLVGMLVAGAILQTFRNKVFIGFAILFGGACLFRLIANIFLARQWEPPLIEEKPNAPSIGAIFLSLRTSNLGKFTAYIALINIVIGMSGPFFAVFMLRDLHFSYTTYMIIISINALSSLIFQRFWGRRADIAGNIKVLRFTSMVLPILPFTYVFTGNPFILGSGEILSGFIWSGFNLSFANFVYDVSEPEIRTKQIAVFMAVTGTALCLGALIGGYAAPHVPELFGYQLRTLFAASGIARVFIILALLKLIVEVRDVPRVNVFELLKGKLNNRNTDTEK